jgi:hypothetical protein
VKKLNAHLIKFGTRNVASAFAYPFKTAPNGLITGTLKAAHVYAFSCKFVAQITSGTPKTVSASAKNSRYVQTDMCGIPTLANVNPAPKLRNANFLLSGLQNIARAYVRTPSGSFHCLAVLVNSIRDAASASTAKLILIGIPLPALVSALSKQFSVLQAPCSMRSAANASSSPAWHQKTAAYSGLTGIGTSTRAIASVHSNLQERYVQTVACPTTTPVNATVTADAILTRRHV